MSTKVRKISLEDIEKVQNLIEQCLSHYMNKNQVIDILYQKQNIEPMLTKLVWERLAEENQRFFQSYHLKLILLDQMTRYNDLLQKQHDALSHPVNTHGVVSYGSHTPSMHHNNGSYYVPENNGIVMKTENMHHHTPAVVHVHDGFNNFGPIIRSDQMQHGPYNMLVGPNMNGVAVNGPGFLGDSEFVYQGHGGGMESQPPVSSFGIVPNHEFNGTVIDDTRSSQLLRHFSHDYSLPDSTPDFTNTTTEPIRFDPSTMLGPYYSGVTADILRNFDHFDQNFGKHS